MTSETEELLLAKIMILNEHVWEGRVPRPRIDEWLENFTGKVAPLEQERLHALYWLSQFMYFGGKEIRVLVRSLYRDLFLKPLIQEARLKLPAGSTIDDLKRKVASELASTRFFGLGNPSESGAHLLYYFRQESQLPKESFMDAVRIFTRDSNGQRQIRKPEIKRYVFLDDICGSGDTAIDYSEEVVSELKEMKRDAIASYYCLFASSGGMERVRTSSQFGQNCGAVYELDDSYKCLTPGTRHFSGHSFSEIDEALAFQMARTYGDLIDDRYTAGWKSTEMLLGFHHNTPDNTIGIIWSDSSWGGSLIPWTPIFRRYPKIG